MMKTMVLFFCGLLWSALTLPAAPTHLVDEHPLQIDELRPGHYLVDFGRVSFGNLRLLPSTGATGEVTVHFGEALKKGHVDRTPPGTVRYGKALVSLEGDRPVLAAPPSDKRNTKTDSSKHPPAILTPPEWGVVLPFRWIEIEGWEGELHPEHLVRQSAFASTWDDEAASFTCSDEMLNRIWALCRYSIKATTFAGVYVDGDRERIPYEADAYINQLCHYYTDDDKEIARDTFDHLMKHPTWPSEWAPHMVFMAYADWKHTGDLEWLECRYESLKTKLLNERVGNDGLVESNKTLIKKGDLVDWPKGERDGFVFTRKNAVVNAFHLRSLEMMREMAEALEIKQNVDAYTKQIDRKRAAFHETFFDAEKGLYRDGVGTEHSSLHANLFPLTFGLVPEAHRGKIADWLAQRGMACSVYAAQYLMEALFENGKANEALALMTAGNDRSWTHMVRSGATISWEAWDLKYKPNQDWNHAWGAAPANLLPRYILGAEPLEPGWEIARIRPNPGSLTSAAGKIPTHRGAILVDWSADKTFEMNLTLPEGMRAQLELPAIGKSVHVLRDGKRVKAKRLGDRLVIEEQLEGSVHFLVKPKGSK